jgi:hypothetical protein
MLGRGEVGVEAVADRIATALPEAKLIALLRDPIERALSNYTMEVRRGQEARLPDVAFADLLEPQGLAVARAYPAFSNSYVIQGEYGRILQVFRSRFPAEQMLVAYTGELNDDPGGLLDKVHAFLGVSPGHRPSDLNVHHFQGGLRKRVDAAAEASLFAHLREELLPHLKGDFRAHADAFGFFFETWNVIPDEAPTAVSGEIRLRLEEHFREDAERLAGLGIPAPWIDRWQR